MHTYKLLIAYDGTAYCGWQIQPNGLSIQQVIQNVIQQVTQQKATVIGSGRTDSGVHALGQVAHFRTEKELDLYRFHGSLNALLPPDIRVLEVTEATPHFHAQFDAIGKTYRYHLLTRAIRDPMRRLYSYHVKERLNFDAIQEAAQLFLGTHDFTSFSNEAHKGAAAVDAVRTLNKLAILPSDDTVCLEFHADGFLYKMVRNIVGTLLEIGEEKRPSSDVERLLAAKDRRQAGRTAPPHALFLVRVDYPTTSLSEDKTLTP